MNIAVLTFRKCGDGGGGRRWAWLTVGWLVVLCWVCLAGDRVSAVGPTSPERRVVFVAIDVMIDPGSTALAAYQAELAIHRRAGAIVGVEPGDEPALGGEQFHFDHRAIATGRMERVIIAAFTVDASAALPRQPFRAATLHIMLTDPDSASYTATLTRAADAQGRPIDGASILLQTLEQSAALEDVSSRRGESDGGGSGAVRDDEFAS